MKLNNPVFYEQSKICGICPFHVHNIQLVYTEKKYNDIKKDIELILQSLYSASLCRGSKCDHWHISVEDPRFGTCDQYE
jgi:hypothetical protein